MTLLWLFWQILISYCKFLMPRPLKWSILGAHTKILSKNIHKVTKTDYLWFEFLWIRRYYDHKFCLKHMSLLFFITFVPLLSFLRLCFCLLFSLFLPFILDSSTSCSNSARQTLENQNSNQNSNQKIVQWNFDNISDVSSLENNTFIIKLVKRFLLLGSNRSLPSEVEEQFKPGRELTWSISMYHFFVVDII